MNKKTTVTDVARIFPEATIEENGGVFSLLVHDVSPSLRLVIPEDLPLGMGAKVMLPGDFHAGEIPRVTTDIGTEFPIWVAAGDYVETEEAPEFHFKDWLAAEKLLVVSRWELVPPLETASGLESPFGKNYQAQALMRILPSDMLGLNPVLPPIPVELTPPFDAETGLDFWVLGRKDFYELECQMLSGDLQRLIEAGDNERQNDAARAVCRQMMEKLAAEIEADERLEGWRLECGDNDAKFTAKDRRGVIRTMTIFYTPAYMVGAQRCVEQGREGVLAF